MLAVSDLKPSGATRGLARLHMKGARIEVLEQAAPYRLLRPLGADVGLDLSVLANISGGLVSGDRLENSVRASGSAHLMQTGQAAEKAYKCLNAPVRLSNVYKAEDQAWLEILPKELIMFEGAKVERDFTLGVHDQAQLLCGDLTILGRTHSGEIIREGLLRDTWSLSIDGDLAYLDRQELDFSSSAETLKSAACLGDLLVFGTLIYAGGQVEAFINTCNALPPHFQVQLAASGFERHGIARLLAPAAPALLHTYGQLWSALRHALRGLPPRLPTLWSL